MFERLERIAQTKSMKLKEIIDRKAIITISNKDQIPILFSMFRKNKLRMFGGRPYSKKLSKDTSFFMRDGEFLVFKPSSGLIAKKEVFKNGEFVPFESITNDDDGISIGSIVKINGRYIGLITYIGNSNLIYVKSNGEENKSNLESASYCTDEEKNEYRLLLKKNNLKITKDGRNITKRIHRFV